MRVGLKRRLRKLEAANSNIDLLLIILTLFLGEEVPDKYAGWIGGLYILRSPLARGDEDAGAIDDPEIRLPSGIIWTEVGGDIMWWAKLREGD